MLKLSEKVILTDPYYNINSDLNKIIAVKKGNHKTSYTRDAKENRIASIMAVHENYNINEDSFIYGGSLAVDSGTMCICDFIYFKDIKERDEKSDLDKLWNATDSYIPNPDYIPFNKIDDFTDCLKTVVENVDNELKKYHAVGDKELLTKALGQEEVWVEDEIYLFVKNIKVDFSLVSDDELEDVYLNNIDKHFSNIRKGNINNKQDIYKNFVVEQIKQLLHLEVVRMKKSIREIPKKIYMQEANVVDDCCFVSGSGYGDGWYPYYVIKEKDEIIAIKIVFIEERDD